jgi:putative flippase GtrA
MADGARFAAAMTAVTRRLPFGLAGVVAPSVVGYLLINLCTFFLDLGLLAIFHGSLRWPVPIAVTLSYGTAGLVSYVANRVLNFRSHGPLGRQLPLYVAIMASNYLIFVLGLTTGLTAAGLYYELARVMAAVCEGVYLYCCMRWIVFRELGRPGPGADPRTEPGKERGPAVVPGGATAKRAAAPAAPRQALGEPEAE